MFALLLWAASAAGAIPIPGTPVPITLQTFVVMLAALTLNWKEAAGAVGAYLVAGALGAPVFAGGTSTMALVGPSAGFLIGFLPGVVIAALLKGKADTNGLAGYARTAARYMLALFVGCTVVVYAFGFLIQSAVTGVPLGVVATASMGFVLGDLIKTLVASLAVSGLAKLF
jgi:biotin transport system substrate-specific component